MENLNLKSQKNPNPSVNFLNQNIRICFLFILSIVLVSLLIAVRFKDFQDTNIAYAINYLSGQAGNDSWIPMADAITQLRENPGTPVYGDIFFNTNNRFQYPVSSVLFLDLSQRMTGLSWEKLFDVLNAISWLFVLAAGIVFYWLFTQSTSLADKKIQIPFSSQIALVIMSLAVVLSFYPILRSFKLGQIQTTLTLIVGLALLAWQHKNLGLAGFFIGICCIIKPQWGLIIIWAVFRRQWKFVIMSLVAIFIPLFISILVYGANHYFEYLSVLSVMGRHGESFYANQSVNGLMHRLFFNGNNLKWLGDVFPPFHPIVYISTISSTILILATAMFWRISKDPNIVDFALIMLSLTIASPIAWEHHYGFLVLVFAIVFPMAIHRKIFGAWTTAFLWIVFLLTSLKLEGITDQFAKTHWNFLQSYLFFGAIMVLILLYRLSGFQNGGEVPGEG